MIILPNTIDAIDIFKYEDSEGIDKIASKINNDDIEIPFEEDVKNLKMDDFACIIKTAEGNLYKFPINSKDNVLLNIHAFLHTQSNLPDEIVKTAGYFLNKAAEFWSIDVDLSKYENNTVKTNIVNFERINERKYLEKIAIPEENRKYSIFALENKYPIDTPELMKQAEFYFNQYGYMFDPFEQYTFANNVIKQAEALSCPLSSRGILKYSHLRYERNPELDNLLKARDTKASTDGSYQEIVKISKKVPLEKIAEAIYEMDKEFNLDKHYNKVVPDPIFTVFSAFEKQAEVIGGKKISLDILQSVPRETFQSLSLTDDTIDELQGEQGIDVLKSLPEPIIDQIVGIL